MGNCQSMFSEDLILTYERLLRNEPFPNPGLNKEVLKAMCKGTYSGIHNNYIKFCNEKKK